MGNAVYPSLPGLMFGSTKAPRFATHVQQSVSLAEARAAFAAYPIWTVSLQYEFLRHGAYTELRQLLGFFLARQGSFDSFLYTDPDDNAVTDQQFGTGDGTTTLFQLKRTFGYGTGATFDEPVMNVNALTNIKKAGVAQSSPSNYSIDANGLVTFTSPPAAASALTWSGSYYYRVRFLQDESQFAKFMQDLFENKKVELLGSPMNKV